MTDKNHAPNSNGGDYEVGYGRPPAATRFQPGASGNTRGRPKGRKNLKTELFDELGQKAPFRVNGKLRVMSCQTVIIKRLIMDATNGNGRAREQLLRLLAQVEIIPGAPAPDPIGAEKGAQILAQTRAHFVAEIKEND